MNSIKLITISSTVTLSFILLLFVIHLLTKGFKSKLNNKGRLKISFAIWYAALFLSGSSIISDIVNAVLEVIDNLININPTNLNVQLIKSGSLIIGVGFVWYFVWYFVVKFSVKVAQFKSDEHQEMEDDNFTYFIVKSAMLIGLIFSLSAILTLILRTLIPNIDMPFYH